MIPELDSLRRAQVGGCNPFKYDFERFLASRNDTTLPVKTVADLIRSRRFHPSIEVRLTAAQAESLPPERNPGCASRDRFREALRTAVLREMDEAARCARLSHVEQPSSPDRRPEHAGWRQQPALLAKHRVSGDHGSYGLHPRSSAGRAAVLWKTVERGHLDPTGVFV